MTRLWAVARNTYLQAIRDRMTGLFLVLILALVLLLTFISDSASRLDTMKTFIAYAVGFGGVLLSLVNIILSCRIICDDIDTHQIYTPITKPVDRRVYLAGRWLGVVLHQATMIAIMGAVIFMTAQYMRSRLGSEGNDILGRRFFTALEKFSPADFEQRLRAMVEEETELRRANGAFDASRTDEEITEMLRVIQVEAIRKLTTAGPNKTLNWRFEKLPMPEPGTQALQLYMKVNASSAFKHDYLNRTIGLHNPDTGETLYSRITLPVGAGKTIDLPNKILSDKGAIVLELANSIPENDFNPIRSSISVGAKDVYILYAVGGFAGNFIRAMLLVLSLQSFLTAIAMLAGSALSLPIALLWSAALYCIGTMSAFLLKSTSKNNLGEIWMLISNNLMKGLHALLPNFSSASPVDRLVEGLVITWSDTFMTMGFFIAIYSGIALIIGGLILHNRELARVIAR